MIEFDGKLFSESLKNHLEGQLKKYPNNVRVNLEKQGIHYKATLICKEFVAKDINEDAYIALTNAATKLKKQYQKYYEKVNDKSGRKGFKGAVRELLEQE